MNSKREQARANKQEALRLQETAARKAKAIKGASLLAGVALTAGVASIFVNEKSSHRQELAQEALLEYSNKFGCIGLSEVEISFDKVIPPAEGYSGGAAAMTVRNKVTLKTDLATSEIRGVMLHESVHACIGKDNLFQTPLELSQEPGMYFVGANGLRPLVGENGDTSNPSYVSFLEEGVADYLASRFDGYVAGSDQYLAANHLAEVLISNAGISDDELATMHQESDLLGFLSRIYSKDKTEINRDDIEGVVYAFQDAFMDAEYFTEAQLEMYYGIPASTY